MASGYMDGEHSQETSYRQPDGFAPTSAPGHGNPDFDQVLLSDIGLTTLLDRLKQSIASVRDFAAFLKKRASIEEDHAKDIKRLAKNTHDSLFRGDSRKGTYLRQMELVMKTHDSMSDNGSQFALALTQLFENMNDLSVRMEQSRKAAKHEGNDAEKKAADAESAANRAKSKYDGLAEDYDRAKTGDIKGSRRIMKGPRSAAQHEEDLLRKLQAADVDYSTKVQSSQAQTAELRNQTRPRLVDHLQNLIRECDSALTLQLQKYAICNENLLVADGRLVAPIPSNGPDSSAKSLGAIMQGIDNDRDLQEHVLAQRSTMGPQPPELFYQQHNSLQSKQQMPLNMNNSQQAASAPIVPPPQQQSPPQQHQQQQLEHRHQPSNQSGHSNFSFEQQQQQQQQQQTLPPSNARTMPTVQKSLPAEPAAPQPPTPDDSYYSAPMAPNYRQDDNSYPANLSHTSPPDHSAYSSLPSHQQASAHSRLPSNQQQQQHLAEHEVPPTAPIFGVDLAELFERTQQPVPAILVTCINAVELFGLTVDGIYRQSGNRSNVSQLKRQFQASSMTGGLDLLNPTAFNNDVYAVADVLKAFLRELPDPLIPRAKYANMLAGARIEDDVARRDALHAEINEFADPNYASMRSLVLHLHKVQSYSAENRMNIKALALCFAPGLLGASQTDERAQHADPALEARVVETIITNALDIFDVDDEPAQ